MSETSSAASANSFERRKPPFIKISRLFHSNYCYHWHHSMNEAENRSAYMKLTDLTDSPITLKINTFFTSDRFNFCYHSMGWGAILIANIGNAYNIDWLWKLIFFVFQFSCGQIGVINVFYFPSSFFTLHLIAHLLTFFFAVVKSVGRSANHPLYKFHPIFYFE